MPQYIEVSRISDPQAKTREVHKVLCTNNNLYYARKRLTKFASEEERIRFERETRIHGALDHRSIIKIADKGKENGLPWYVMPLAKMSLRDYMNTHGPKEKALWAVVQAAEGVSYAHNRGYIHRDLKPDNILLFVANGKTGKQAKVTDLGLGKCLTDSTPCITNTAYPGYGTPLYAAPEQRRNASAVDYRADIYSLGVILFEVLTNEKPFMPFDSSLISYHYWEIVSKATEADPNKRYQSATEFLTSMAEAENLVLSGAKYNILEYQKG